MMIALRLILFVVFSSSVYSQTCRGVSQYGQCSTNNDCGCLPLANSENSGICGFLWVDCSRLESCQTPGNTCEKSDHMCVRLQCKNEPVCYPLSMIDQRMCPPLGAMPSPTVPKDGICATATWSRQGVTVAGGYGWGNGLNQLNDPLGIFIDANRTIYIADTNNARIVKWAKGATYGEIVAGGYGAGAGTAQLYGPMDVVVDKSGAIYITDTMNNRVQKWNRNAKVGETIIIVQRPIGLALDNEDTLYVSASYRSHDVLKLRKGEKNGYVIASNLPELYYLFAHQNRSIYAADKNNGRILKIDESKSQISFVIGQLQNLGVSQLSYPQSVVVDQSGSIYVVEYGNHRVTRWLPGAKAGIVIAGGRGQGWQSDQLNLPTDIALDLDGNLYVADRGNHRVQKLNAQTCQGALKYDQCSSNSFCGCLPLISNGISGICAYLGLTCSDLNSCTNDNQTCYEPGHVCVLHTNCHSAALCYPLNMATPVICPPITFQTTTPISTIPNDSICANATWNKTGITVAGGNGSESFEIAVQYQYGCYD
ncbi:unnamed protein product [Rotaria sp. Silwood1]|nr:unnamed protein product [Rotaria sp. Silwood1]